jgi:hypothetical protein
MKVIKVVELLKDYETSKRTLILRQEELKTLLNSNDLNISAIKHACHAFLDAEGQFKFLDQLLNRFGVSK